MKANSTIGIATGASHRHAGAENTHAYGHSHGPLAGHLYTLVEWRLTSFGLNPKAIERQCPNLLADSRARCALCTNKHKCLEGMMEHRIPRGWEDYCPNARTIRELCAISGPLQAWTVPTGDCRESV
jgi:hypothetical protein